MAKYKEASIGVFIRDSLTFDKKPPKRLYIYEMWKEYNYARKDSGKKGIEYKAFSNYIWVLKNLKLIKSSPAPRGQRFKPDVSPLSEMVPDEWTKSYVQLNYDKPEDRYEILEHPAWNNPFKYYRILIGSEKYFSTKEKKLEWKAVKLMERWNIKHPMEKITEREALNKFDEYSKELHKDTLIEEAKHPSHEETVLIRIPKELKAIIDKNRKDKTIISYLIDVFTKAGLYP